MPVAHGMEPGMAEGAKTDVYDALPIPTRPLRRTRVERIREVGVRYGCDGCGGTGVEHEQHLRYHQRRGELLRTCYVERGKPLGGACTSCKGRGYLVHWTEVDDDGV